MTNKIFNLKEIKIPSSLRKLGNLGQFGKLGKIGKFSREISFHKTSIGNKRYICDFQENRNLTLTLFWYIDFFLLSSLFM